jgi:hypothetical protein
MSGDEFGLDGVLAAVVEEDAEPAASVDVVARRLRKTVRSPVGVVLVR